MKIELNDTTVTLKQIEPGETFIHKDKITGAERYFIKSSDNDADYTVCVNLKNGDIARFSPSLYVIPISLKVVERGVL